MKNIILIGFGGLGKRYLEVIAEISSSIGKVNLFLYEKNIDDARRYLDKISNTNNSLDILLIKQLIDVQVDKIDLCVIATTATGRAKLINEVNELFQPEHWILEKPLEVSVSGMHQIGRILEGQKVWVNTPRALFSSDRKVIEELKRSDLTPSHIIVTGVDWGLLSNSIHWIALFSEMELGNISNVELRINAICQTKRIGYQDVHGSIHIVFENGTNITMASDRGVNKGISRVEGHAADGQRLFLYDYSRNKIEIIGAEYDLVSDELLTNYGVEVFKSLLLCGKCELPQLNNVLQITTDMISEIESTLDKYCKLKMIDRIQYT